MRRIVLHTTLLNIKIQKIHVQKPYRRICAIMLKIYEYEVTGCALHCQIIFQNWKYLRTDIFNKNTSLSEATWVYTRRTSNYQTRTSCTSWMSQYYTLILSVGWRIQTNNAPVSGRALASSDTSGMSLYTSPYWLYKCFIIPILRNYIIYQI